MTGGQKIAGATLIAVVLWLAWVSRPGFDMEEFRKFAAAFSFGFMVGGIYIGWGVPWLHKRLNP